MERIKRMRTKKIVLKGILLVVSAAIAVYWTTVAVNQYKMDKRDEETFISIKEQAEESADINIVDELKKINEDVVGYLEISGTSISYPVMQTKDEPDYYLNRNIDKEYSFYGTPYMDANCDMDKNDNMIIYGHNINNREMFGALMQYKYKEFYEEHRDIYFTTDEKVKYEIFAVMSVDVREFPYWEYVNIGTVEEYDNFIEQVAENCLYAIDLDVGFGSKMLMLYTCDNSKGDAWRLVVLGVNCGGNK